MIFLLLQHFLCPFFLLVWSCKQRSVRETAANQLPNPCRLEVGAGMSMKGKIFFYENQFAMEIVSFRRRLLQRQCRLHFVNIWDMYNILLPALPFVVPHHNSLTHSLYSVYCHITGACMQHNFEMSPLFPPFEIYVNSVFVFHQTTQIEELTLFSWI
jgi:hypothetical protein